MFCAAPMWAATASKSSKHHWSRSADPESAYASSSMAAIVATRQAQAAFSTRDHDDSAPAPRVPVVASTRSSNMNPVYGAGTTKSVLPQAFCG